MERRTFVKGAFGFVALATLGVVGAAVGANASHTSFVTAPIPDVESARGPAMAAGIELVENGNVVHGSLTWMPPVPSSCAWPTAAVP